jgi:hypothetical protein
MTERFLACLESHANNRGVVIARQDVLLREVGASQAEAAAALEALEHDGLVDVLSPLPFLVLKLRKLSGMPVNASIASPSAYSYSKQLLQTKQLKDSYRLGDEAATAAAGLLREILKTLGETDAASFEKAVELYSPNVIRTALDRVRRARGIRKSRTALFRHLLPRLARANQNPD